MTPTEITTPAGTSAPEASIRRGLDLTFRAKLLLSMCGLVLLTGAAIIAVADHGHRTSNRTLVDALFREVSSHAVTQTRDFVLRAAPVAESLEQLASHGLALDDMDQLAPQLLAFLQGNPGMTWVLFGSETGDYVGATRLPDQRLHIERTRLANGKTHLTEYEVQPDGSWKIFKEDDNYGYDPRQRPWYKLAKEKGTLAWTEPYMFFTQGVPGISCVIPVYKKTTSESRGETRGDFRGDFRGQFRGDFRGVFSVEFDLNALSEFVRGVKLSAHSRVFLFMPDGTLLAHPNQASLPAIGVKGAGALLTLEDTGDPLVDAFRQHLHPEFVRSGTDAEFHFFAFAHDGVDYLASTTVFPIGDGQSWVVGAVAPQADFMAAATRARWQALAAAAAALGLAALLAAALAQHISGPFQLLVAFMQRVGGGDLEARAEFTGSREFRQLSAALNRMLGELRERLQLRHSLHVAMEVQKSLLPARDPSSPRGLDVAGRSKYCDQTGGDYYDFIDVTPLSSSSLLIAVGDVMGHGIAAALLMASAQAALRSGALGKLGLGALLTHTNQVLAKNNRHDRFMTLALLQIDTDAGQLTWASAGHDPALVFEPQTNEFRELEGGDVPLGLMEGVDYAKYTSHAPGPGGVLLIGTDGVWEMQNPQHEQFGKDRLRAVLRQHHTSSAAQIAAALDADLTAFRGDRAPDDDVTFVIVKFLSRDEATPHRTDLSVSTAKS